MTAQKIINKGIHALYEQDAELADKLIWGRKIDPVTRRGFLRQSGLLAMSATLGACIPFASKMPGGMIPAALAASAQPFVIPGKSPGLIVLNDRPLNAETPAELLDDSVTPRTKCLCAITAFPRKISTRSPGL